MESGAAIGTIDLYAAAAPCTRDNLLQFTAPSTFVYDEGPTKCDPSNPQTRLGTWKLDSDGKQLTVNEGGYTSVYSIDELTATSLKLTLPEVQGTVTAVLKNTYAAGSKLERRLINPAVWQNL